MTTNKGATFSRGTFQQTDRAYTQLFTQEKPFIGVMGYQSTVLKALGFFTFLCKDGVPGEEKKPDPTSPAPTDPVNEDSLDVEATESKDGFSAGWIVLVIVALIVGAAVAIVIRLRKRRIRQKIQMMVSDGNVKETSEAFATE